MARPCKILQFDLQDRVIDLYKQGLSTYEIAEALKRLNCEISPRAINRFISSKGLKTNRRNNPKSVFTYKPIVDSTFIDSIKDLSNTINLEKEFSEISRISDNHLKLAKILFLQSAMILNRKLRLYLENGEDYPTKELEGYLITAKSLQIVENKIMIKRSKPCDVGFQALKSIN